MMNDFEDSSALRKRDRDPGTLEMPIEFVELISKTYGAGITKISSGIDKNNRRYSVFKLSPLSAPLEVLCAIKVKNVKLLMDQGVLQAVVTEENSNLNSKRWEDLGFFMKSVLIPLFLAVVFYCSATC